MWAQNWEAANTLKQKGSTWKFSTCAAAPLLLALSSDNALFKGCLRHLSDITKQCREQHIPRNNFQLLLHLLGESDGHYSNFPAGLRHMKALIGSILCLQREAKDHSPRLIKQGACEALKQAQKTNRKSKTCFAKQNIATLAKCLSPKIVVEDNFHVSFCSDEY